MLHVVLMCFWTGWIHVSQHLQNHDHFCFFTPLWCCRFWITRHCSEFAAQQTLMHGTWIWFAQDLVFHFLCLCSLNVIAQTIRPYLYNSRELHGHFWTILKHLDFHKKSQIRFKMLLLFIKRSLVSVMSVVCQLTLAITLISIDTWI